MTATEAPLIAFVGFRRHRWVPIGGTVRVLVVRDRRVRILGKTGRIELDVPTNVLTARLTKTRMVELRTDTEWILVWGVAERTTIKKELRAIASTEFERATANGEHDVEFIGPVPHGVSAMVPVKEAVGVSRLGRVLAEALHDRGALEG